jgi:hypothetical protein
MNESMISPEIFIAAYSTCDSNERVYCAHYMQGISTSHMIESQNAYSKIAPLETKLDVL